jgi:hypothetical protein
VGAKITLNGKELYLAKVNDKTFYATEYNYQVFQDKLKMYKSKSMTFLQMAKTENLQKLNYGEAEISEEQIKEATKLKEAKAEKLFSRETDKKLISIANRMVKNNCRFGSIFEEDKKQISVMELRGHVLLLNKENKLYLYNLKNFHSIYCGDIFDKKITSSKIEWEKIA